MRAREKLPLLWLALGDFLRSEGKEEQALEAFAHGRRSDGRLESREGRVCLMRVCWASVARGVSRRRIGFGGGSEDSSCGDGCV